MRIRVVALVLLVLTLCSCGTVSTGDVSEYVDLTQLEIDLLVGCYQDADRIHEGRLFKHQDDALEQLRAGDAYMKAKYPSQTFTYVSFEPATKFSGHATLYLDAVNCEVSIAPVGETYHCSDSFYETLLKDKYDAYLHDILVEKGYEVLTDTQFPSLLDGTLGEDASVEDYLRQYPKLTRHTDIYLDTSPGHRGRPNDLQDTIISEGIYGSYTVYYVSDGLLSIENLSDARDTYVFSHFNCFDV